MAHISRLSGVGCRNRRWQEAQKEKRRGRQNTEAKVFRFAVRLDQGRKGRQTGSAFSARSACGSTGRQSLYGQTIRAAVARTLRVGGVGEAGHGGGSEIVGAGEDAVGEGGVADEILGCMKKWLLHRYALSAFIVFEWVQQIPPFQLQQHSTHQR